MLYEIHKNKTFVWSSIVLHNHRTSKHMAPQHITLSNETYTANKVMQLSGSICITERELYIANYICKMYFFFTEVSILCYIWQGHFTHETLGRKQHPHKKRVRRMVGYKWPLTTHDDWYLSMCAKCCKWTPVRKSLLGSHNRSSLFLTSTSSSNASRYYLETCSAHINQWNWQPVVTSHAAWMARFSALN